MFVIYVNRCGEENGMRFFGHSTFAGPEGTILAELEGEANTSCVVECKLEEIELAEQLHPFMKDLRIDLFRE